MVKSLSKIFSTPYFEKATKRNVVIKITTPESYIAFIFGKNLKKVVITPKIKTKIKSRIGSSISPKAVAKCCSATPKAPPINVAHIRFTLLQRVPPETYHIHSSDFGHYKYIIMRNLYD